jgi:hypothetical protein
LSTKTRRRLSQNKRENDTGNETNKKEEVENILKKDEIKKSNMLCLTWSSNSIFSPLSTLACSSLTTSALADRLQAVGLSAMVELSFREIQCTTESKKQQNSRSTAPVHVWIN